jgi:hypothetical protein
MKPLKDIGACITQCECEICEKRFVLTATERRELVRGVLWWAVNNIVDVQERLDYPEALERDLKELCEEEGL